MDERERMAPPPPANQVPAHAPAPAAAGAQPAAQIQGLNVGPGGLGGVFQRNGGLGAAHQALLQRECPAGFQPYLRPPFFPLRILLLLIIMCISLSLASTVFLTLPGT